MLFFLAAIPGRARGICQCRFVISVHDEGYPLYAHAVFVVFVTLVAYCTYLFMNSQSRYRFVLFGGGDLAEADREFPTWSSLAFGIDLRRGSGYCTSSCQSAAPGDVRMAGASIECPGFHIGGDGGSSDYIWRV